MQYIFNTIRFSEQRELQLASAVQKQFVYLFIKYPLKMNPLINPLARNGKFGWYNTFRKHVNMSTPSTNAKLVLIGDSIIANFDKCSNIFDKFFLPFRTLNFGISRDKIQNVLWCVYNMTLPASVEHIIFTVTLIILDTTVH